MSEPQKQPQEQQPQQEQQPEAPQQPEPKPEQQQPTFVATVLTAVGITLVAFIASWFIPGELTSLEVFTPKEKASDFSFSDFYTMVANNTGNVRTDPDITIVAVDGCTRAEMGRAIAVADSCGAAVIGLDLIFSPPTTDSDPIIEAIDTAHNIVLPTVLEGGDQNRFTESRSSYFMPALSGNYTLASANINGDMDNSTTRYFKPEFRLNDEIVPSMATAIAELYRPGSAGELIDRGNDMEMINFSNREFIRLTPGEMIENSRFIRDHIVLIGYANDPADTHRSPLVNKMPGIDIHAHTIATVIGREYINYSPHWMSVALAMLVCCLIIVAGLYSRKHLWGAILVRLLQVAVMFGVLYAGSLIYIRCHYSFDFMPAITVSILGLVIMDVVIGLSVMASNAFKVLRHYTRLVVDKINKPGTKDNPKKN